MKKHAEISYKKGIAGFFKEGDLKVDTNRPTPDDFFGDQNSTESPMKSDLSFRMSPSSGLPMKKQTSAMFSKLTQKMAHMHDPNSEAYDNRLKKMKTTLGSTLSKLSHNEDDPKPVRIPGYDEFGKKIRAGLHHIV
jgi:hypothetical protein